MKRYLKALKKRSADFAKRLTSAYYTLCAPDRAPLNRYSTECPNPQQIVNLFEGEWMSAFPAPFEEVKAGIYPLFNDGRLKWGMDRLGGVKGKKVIELGPLEGGHSFMVERSGADSVIAVEGNPRAFLRCMIVKEMMKLAKVHFLFGDFNEYLKSTSEHFDFCIASGVLYHMKEPVELLKLISEHAQELFLWTQYYDESICSKGGLKKKFLAPYSRETAGFRHTLHPFKYGASRLWSTFIGGPARTSCWLSRQEILDALHHFGFISIEVACEETSHPHGPSFALIARKVAGCL